MMNFPLKFQNIGVDNSPLEWYNKYIENKRKGVINMMNFLLVVTERAVKLVDKDTGEILALNKEEVNEVLTAYEDNFTLTLW